MTSMFKIVFWFLIFYLLKKKWLFFPPIGFLRIFLLSDRNHKAASYSPCPAAVSFGHAINCGTDLSQLKRGSGQNPTGRLPQLPLRDRSKITRCMFQEHFNFVGTDDQLGPVLLSVKTESLASQEQTRLLLRLRTGTTHELVPSSCATSAPHHMARVSTNIKNCPTTPCCCVSVHHDHRGRDDGRSGSSQICLKCITHV